MPKRLSDVEIREQLPPNWEREDDEIVRTFGFDDYLVGVSFAVDVAELAEEEFHHPTITIDYEEVTVRFTTHEVDAISDRDIELADLVNDLA